MIQFLKHQIKPFLPWRLKCIADNVLCFLRRTADRVCELLSLRLSRVHEEPRSLPDHRGANGDQRHQVRTDSRVPAVQSRYRASVWLVRYHLTRSYGPSVPAGVPESESNRLSVSAEPTRTLFLAQLDAEPHARVSSDVSAQWILITGSGTRSPLHELHRALTPQCLQLTQCTTRCSVNTSAYVLNLYMCTCFILICRYIVK